MSATASAWTRKDLIGIEDLSRAELELIYDKAEAFKTTLGQPDTSLGQVLKGYTVVNLFMEPSTRTRLAFEIAAKRLGADVITVSGQASSLVKGETLRDTAMNIQALGANLIIMRHSAAGSARYLSQVIDIPVINGGDGAHEHPTQALLDTFTLREKFGKDLSRIKITILGDILFSRVARSNIWALQKLGAQVTLAGPSTLVPKEFEKLGVNVCHNLKEALADADAVMLLRIQHERQTSTHFPSIGEYKSIFGLDERRASWLKPGAIIMHPGPINRGVEIDSRLADSGSSVILEQVTNGVAVRMAAIYFCATAHTAAVQQAAARAATAQQDTGRSAATQQGADQQTAGRAAARQSANHGEAKQSPGSAADSHGTPGQDANAAGQGAGSDSARRGAGRTSTSRDTGHGAV